MVEQGTHGGALLKGLFLHDTKWSRAPHKIATVCRSAGLHWCQRHIPKRLRKQGHLFPSQKSRTSSAKPKMLDPRPVPCI